MSADEPIQHVNFTFESDISKDITIKMVENVPVQLGCYADCDDYVLSDKSGVYPDILRDFEPRDVVLRAKKWIACMVSVNSRKVGNHTINFSLTNDDGEIMARCSYNLEILPERLGDYDLIYTNWMHYDCIADLHHAKVFSKRFYKITERYIKSAVEHGMTMLLTPLFTPALDTYVGGERPTVQLVDVYLENGKYSFDFSRLDDFIQRVFSLGIKDIEFSHLFSQWGAEFAPKIMAYVNGRYKRIFGWETKSVSDEYIQFIDAFLPALLNHIEEKGIKDKCYFHLSDEPHESHLDTYMKLYRVMKKHLGNSRTIDALSTVDFYLKGTVDIPVVHIDYTKPFEEHNIEYWTYYCCSSANYHANRYISMPSLRNRILGTQLYLMNVKGFLHWGYNFYNCQFSHYPIDPYGTTDGDGFVPAGDTFQVYPGKDGEPVESIRMMVFDECIADMRALKMLEGLTSREHVLALIQEGFDREITFYDYPRNDDYLPTLREKVNAEIMDKLGK